MAYVSKNVVNSLDQFDSKTDSDLIATVFLVALIVRSAKQAVNEKRVVIPFRHSVMLTWKIPTIAKIGFEPETKETQNPVTPL